jgi:hypothetical protein
MTEQSKFITTEDPFTNKPKFKNVKLALETTS